MDNRVVVTGIGVVAPNGIGKDAFWQALNSGHSGVNSIRRFDSSSMKTQIAGEVTGLDPLDYFDANELKKVDRSNVFALAASLGAIKDAGLDLSSENPERIGSSIGNAVCGVEYAQNENAVIYGKGPRWGSPYLAIAFFPCGSNGLLSIRLKMKGPVLTFCNGNTSGTDAIGMAFRLIRSGRADIMLAGGTEAPLVPLVVGSLSRDGWLSQRNDNPSAAARPFDRDADGMVLGEGSGMLVLENESHARARGARIYAELAAYSSVNSGIGLFDPEPDGLGIVRTMKNVLTSSHHAPSEVSWVNAQGLSIPAFDQMEARCVQRVFGEAKPRVSAVSSWTGNSLGAMGGIQAVASALAIDQQVFPPSGNLQCADPSYDLDFVGRTATAGAVDLVIQNAYCFIGKNSSLAFRSFPS